MMRFLKRNPFTSKPVNNFVIGFQPLPYPYSGYSTIDWTSRDDFLIAFAALDEKCFSEKPDRTKSLFIIVTSENLRWSRRPISRLLYQSAWAQTLETRTKFGLTLGLRKVSPNVRWY